jgi:hypothetical protein
MTVIAKIHCIADSESIDRAQHGNQHSDLLPLDIIPRHSEITVRDAIGGNDDAFVKDMVSFAMVSCFYIKTFCIALWDESAYRKKNEFEYKFNQIKFFYFRHMGI